MSDNQTPGHFNPPTAPGYPQPDTPGIYPPGYPLADGTLYPAPYEPPVQYPQPDQWNQPPPMPYGPSPVQPAGQRTWMLVVGILLAAFGGMALLSQGPVAAREAVSSADSSSPAFMVGLLIGIIIVGWAPLIVGIVMIVRSKRRR